MPPEADLTSFPHAPDEQFREYFYEQVARLGKALSSAPRLILVNSLCQGERSVDALARVAGLTPANTSRHLQALKQARLVVHRRDGNRILYSMTGDDAIRFFLALKEFAATQLPEVRQALAEISVSPTRRDPIDTDELRELVQAGSATIVDVRPVEEYRCGHIPSARSLPLDELPRRLDELPRGRPVAVLCRGPYCVLADQAVAILLEAGFEARRAQAGVVEWRLAGLPVEASAEERP